MLEHMLIYDWDRLGSNSKLNFSVNSHSDICSIYALNKLKRYLELAKVSMVTKPYFTLNL